MAPCHPLSTAGAQANGASPLPDCHARHLRTRWQAVSGVMFVNVVCGRLAERPIRSGQLQHSPALHRPGGLPTA
jgi:hypothetical protein